MTNQEMLTEMRSSRGILEFGVSTVQHVFRLGYNDASRWIDWLIESGSAKRTNGMPWKVTLL